MVTPNEKARHPGGARAPRRGVLSLFLALPLMLAVPLGQADSSGSSPEASRAGCGDSFEHASLRGGDPRTTSTGPAAGLEDILCDGIRPGKSIYDCTLGFIFRDSSAYFASTAGHCRLEGEPVFAPRIGRIGVTVFSTGNGGVGNDFALIRIDADKESLVTGEMCFWGGPSGSLPAGSILGRAIVQVGHGSGLAVDPTLGDQSPPPRPRVGVGASFQDSYFAWEGSSLPGDSGGPVRVADTIELDGHSRPDGLALGIVTHVGPNGLQDRAINFGTTIPHGLALAAAAGMDDLELVTSQEFLPV